jgi:solute carrier family 25 (adenine nucleotide translocator) protein 4/5/6/31
MCRITFLYPLGFLRTRLAADIGNAYKQERVYPNGMRDVTRSIWRSDGFKGFYKGYGIALASVTVYRVVYLGGYDFLKSEIHVKNGDGGVSPTIGQKFLAAQSVSMAASMSYYPLDSVRRRMMMEAGKLETERMYRNSMHCFQRILKEEGLRGFYLGIYADLARSVGAALVLVSYDEIKRLMHQK